MGGLAPLGGLALPAFQMPQADKGSFGEALAQGWKGGIADANAQKQQKMQFDTEKLQLDAKKELLKN